MHLRFWLAGALTGLAMLLPALPASASTITVNTAADSSTATSDCTLRDAIHAANTNLAVSNSGCTPGQATPTVDTIEFSLPPHTTINLASELEHINEDVAIVGPGAAQLNIHRSSGGDYRIFTIGDTTLLGTASISGLTISGGIDDTGKGGGIRNGGDTLKLSGVVVTGNTSNPTPTGAANGGGISNYGTLDIDRSTVSGNAVNASSATNIGVAVGGGIYNSGTLNIDHTTISGNNATATSGNPAALATGAGIDSTDAATATIRRSTISGNTASASGATATNNNEAQGGGIFMSGTVLDRVTVSGNTAALPSGGVVAYGGGVFANRGSNHIQSSTLTANTAKGIANFISEAPASVFANTIVSNPKGGGANCFSSPAATSNGFNLEDDPGPSPTCGFTKLTDRAGIDPKLGPLQNNGGPTKTRALLPGSPAIDQGHRAAGEATDQRGLHRPSDFGAIQNAAGGDGSDIGAFERQDVVPPNTKITAHPKKKVRKRTVKFRFKSSEPGSHFQCKLDTHPYAPCTSAKKYKHLALGHHTFRVRAIDLAGNVDPSPAKFRFKVVAKKV